MEMLLLPHGPHLIFDTFALPLMTVTPDGQWPRTVV